MDYVNAKWPKHGATRPVANPTAAGATPSGSKADPHDIFIQASRFRNSCLLIAGALAFNEAYAVPLTVLHAFAIELYLKCLLHLTGKPDVEGHELKADLFDKLDASTKKLVTTYYVEELQREPLLLTVVGRLRCRRRDRHLI